MYSKGRFAWIYLQLESLFFGTFRKIFINHSIGSCGHRTGLYFLWPPEKIVIKRFGTLKPLPQDLKDERQLYINEKIQEL